MGPSSPHSICPISPISHYGQTVRPELIHSCYYSALHLFINYLESCFTNQIYKATGKLPYNAEH